MEKHRFVVCNITMNEYSRNTYVWIYINIEKLREPLQGAILNIKRKRERMKKRNNHGWVYTTMTVVEVTVVCVKHYFLSFLLRNIFPARAAHSKGAMIVSLFLQLIHFIVMHFIYYTARLWLCNNSDSFELCKLKPNSK